MSLRKHYPKVNELFYNAPSNYSGALLTCHFFDGTIAKEETDEETIYHYDLGITPTDLQVMWFNYFAERQLGKPMYPVGTYAYFYNTLEAHGSRIYIDSIDTAYSLEASWLYDTTLEFLKANKDKYLKLVDTIGYKYNPISNYDMTETKDITNGEETVTHVVDKNGKTLNFESNQVDLTAPITTDMDGADAHISNWSSTSSDSIKNKVNSPDITVHESTTYDSDSYRNEWRETSGEDSETEQETKLVPKASEQLYQGEEYTDTKSRDNDSYELKRSGNIGVTTSQQMIESEREVARFNLLKEFFEDLNHYVLLAKWS